MENTPTFDLGIVAEGIVEKDPVTGLFGVQTIGSGGRLEFQDIQKLLEKYNGAEVRFIITPLSTVSQLASMLAEGDIVLSTGELKKESSN